MSGASGRLWLTNDGRGRIELQSDAGDAQIVWNDEHDLRLRRLVEHRLPGRPPRARPRRRRRPTGRAPTLADIDNVARPSSACTGRSPTRSRPTSPGGPPTRVSRLAEARRRPARLASSSPGTPRRACRSRAGGLRAGQPAPGARAHRDRHLLRRRAPTATSTSRRPPARRSSTSAPARIRQRLRRDAGGDRARRRPGGGRLPRRRARLRSSACRAATSGWSAATRRVVALRRGPRRDRRSSSARPTRPAPAASALSGLPTVSLDGADRARARDPARDRARVAGRRHELRARRLAAGGGRGGRGAGREVSDGRAGRGPRPRQALRRDRRRRPRRPRRSSAATSSATSARTAPARRPRCGCCSA